VTDERPVLCKVHDWPSSESVGLRPEYLLGAMAASYRTAPRAAYSLVDKAVTKDASARTRRDIGGDKQRINSVCIEYEHLDLSYVLAPIWTSSYYDQGRTFNVRVNGRTGKTTGEYPKSKPRVIGTATVVAAAIGALLTLGIMSNHQARQRDALTTAQTSVCLDASQTWSALQAGSVPTTGLVSDGQAAGDPYRALVENYQRDATANRSSAALSDLQQIAAACTAGGNGALVSDMASPINAPAGNG
jgi:hypothetical protein